MKFSFLLVSIILLEACNNPDAATKEKKSFADSAQGAKPDSSIATGNSNKDPAGSISSNSLMQTSDAVLQTLKLKDFAKLASFINPQWGLRFTPYAYIDTNDSQRLTAAQLVELGRSQKKIKWGVYDGSGKPINLSIDHYFDKFVYSKDFLNAEKKSINKSMGGGNSLDNLKEIYSNADYTEFYFSGFDPKYDGMDWQKLRLVFKTQDGRTYLIAIIHDQWTI
jgi:hypothetical protein